MRRVNKFAEFHTAVIIDTKNVSNIAKRHDIIIFLRTLVLLFMQ